MKRLRRLGNATGFVASFVACLWGSAGLVVMAGCPLMIVVLPVALWCWSWRGRRAWALGLSWGVAWLVAMVVFVWLRPRHDREWDAPYVRLPEVEIAKDGTTVSVSGMRDFVWRTSALYEARWTSEVFDVAALDALDLVIEPLADSDHFAHVMLSFGFGAERRVVVSIEARREKTESFGLVPGLYRQFELIYQITTEEDSLVRRSLDPNSHLYIVPLDPEPAFLREFFLDMMRSAQELTVRPRFYHSLRSNCTTALFDHMNAQLPNSVRYGKEVLFPAQAPGLLGRLGWLQPGLEWPRDKASLRSAEGVRIHAGAADFSQKIRGASS